jgi:uncharacterized protein YjbJ (UPF0337 family)
VAASKDAATEKSAELTKGVGKLTCAEKLKRAGRFEGVRGRAQNTVGGLKDTLREDRRENR